MIHLVHTESLGRPQVRYLRLFDEDGTFDEPRIVSRTAQRDTAASFPALAVDGDHIVITWEHHPDPRRSARGIEVTVSQNGGDTFTAPSVIPGTSAEDLGDSGARQGKLMRKLAVRDGRIAVVSSHFLEGERSRVRLVSGRLRPSVR